jgi:hypothetical protein
VNLEQFTARYPEFAKADKRLIQATLDEAAREVAKDIYRTKFDAAHGALTAHRLAISPFGRNARLSDGSITTYWDAYDQIRREVAPRFMVL